MAPQETASYYGAVVMDRGEKSSPTTSPMAKRIAVAVLAAMAVMGVATMMASSSVPVRETAVVDTSETVLPDCVCVTPCQYLYEADDEIYNTSDATLKPDWVDLTNERIKVFIEKKVMVCKIADGNHECRDVTHARSSSSRAGKPQKYGKEAYVAVCETFDTNCASASQTGTAAGVCGSHGFCVAKAFDALKTDAVRAQLKDHTQYDCVCDPGYLSVGGTCQNINECDLDLDNCNADGRCIDQDPDLMGDEKTGKFICECPTEWGYEGRGYDFKDGLNNGIIGDEGTVNEPGCTDIDECFFSDGEKKHSCVNVAQIPKPNGDREPVPCSENQYKQFEKSGDDSPLYDNGFCVTGVTRAVLTDDCTDMDAGDIGRRGEVDGATGQPGRYHCNCEVGWNPDSYDCKADINECELNGCPLNSQCTNSLGSFTCQCNTNWASTGGEGDFACSPVNKCDSDPCEHGGTCTTGTDGCGFDQNTDASKDWYNDAITRNIITTTAFRNKELFDNQKTSETSGGWGTLNVPCYTCECTRGWTGGDCEVDVDECITTGGGDEHGCDTNADCINTAGSFECICHLGFYMDILENETHTIEECKDIDDCATITPCAHAGTCNDCGTLCFTCSCAVGWRGTTCTKDWNECNMGIHTCNDEATCVNTPGSYACACDPGFTGNGQGQSNNPTAYTEDIGVSEEIRAKNALIYLNSLSTKDGCIDINDCGYNTHESPCKNGATCEDLGSNSYKCLCTPGWTDTECDEDVNECNPAEVIENKCSPFAKCINKERGTDSDGYDCACNRGYTGDGQVCTDINDCSIINATTGANEMRCKENGFCKDLGVDYFKCECVAGYIGSECNTNENECLSPVRACFEGYQCMDTDGSFECNCKEGYSDSGTYGEGACEEIDDCILNSCGHGLCNNIIGSVGHFRCTCYEGWTDKMCDYDVNECLTLDPCHASAVCRNTQGSYTCTCLSGFEGNGTECKDVDDCAINNGGCKAGSTCDSGMTSGANPLGLSGNMRVCHCEEGYRGCGDPFCKTDCPDCPTFKTEKSTCLEVTGGTCTQTCNIADGNGQTGYWGAEGKCAIECKACSSCLTGYTIATNGACTTTLDTVCENIDECLTGPNECTNDHAGCFDTEGSYECACQPGWFGLGIGAKGCGECTVCRAGFHETSPCTSTSDRLCAIDLPSGKYIIESEADGNRQCLAILTNEWYPTRIDYGNTGVCGLEVRSALNSEFVWSFFNLNNNEADKDSQLYTISHDSKCMYFGSMGKDIYPTLQSCVDYTSEATCPWGGNADSLCGFGDSTETAGGSAEERLAVRKQELIDNRQAVFRVESIKMSEKKYIIQGMAQGTKEGFECIVFDNEGAATNPSRYNWGNGDAFCGVGDWEGFGKEMALISNKQAIFILSNVLSNVA